LSWGWTFCMLTRWWWIWSNKCYNWVKKRNSYSVPGYSHYHPPSCALQWWGDTVQVWGSGDCMTGWFPGGSKQCSGTKFEVFPPGTTVYGWNTGQSTCQSGWTLPNVEAHQLRWDVFSMCCAQGHATSARNSNNSQAAWRYV
jgi:hypothetical protein